ncbi:poly-gamma-glutamate hydrolase family protein, partial [Staphylococcus epidermidis]|uniref:poly-gamma-glutamate hydrolase family protein n=1 Tax=Staphylococcus epidermidis TaxID=1282 RepID=UPI0037DA62C8
MPPTHHTLIHLITQSLQHIPITLPQPPHHISPTQQNNILNITQTQPPLQLQLTPHLTNHLFKNTKTSPKNP